jgi:hypothetical protein
MIRILVLGVVISLTIATSCLGQRKLFKDFKEKFPLKELPLSIPQDCSDRSANDPSDISQVELSELLKLNTDFWQTGDEFYYNTGCRITISNDLDAILYYRSYLPFDFSKQISECVLAVFQEGHLVDTLTVQGSVGDDLSFKSFINKDLKIIVMFEKLTLDKSGKSIIATNTEKYSINGKGEIIRLEAEKN